MEKTAVKAFKTLELLASSEEPQGITALSQLLGLGKSNVHRILATLASMDYVRAVGGGRYEATLRMWEIGTNVLTRSDVKQLATPLLKQLVSATGETAHLSVLDKEEVVYIDKIEGDHAVRFYSRIGARAPAHAVATGKALLAFQAQSVLEKYAARLPATGFTSKTVTSQSQFMSAMAEIRRSGVAYNTGEWRDRVCGIAAPIWDNTGAVVAAIGISGPSERFPVATFKKFSPVVIEAAGTISKAMGYHG